MTDMAPLIIAVAPNGARKTKDDHPGLPMTASDSAREAAICKDAGAAMIHLHVRDDQGKHSLDADLYKAAISAIRSEVGDDLIIQATTEAVGMYSAHEQMAMVRTLKPEAISTAVRELIPDDASESVAAEFYNWAMGEQISVQYILYDDSDVNRLIDLKRRGVIPGDKLSVLYVLGRYSKGQRSDPDDLLPFINAAAIARENWHWSMCAFGAKEGSCALSAASQGGHVRVGFENNMLLNDGSMAAGNADLVEQVKKGATLMDRPIATAQQAREILTA
jgi:uncharacterized protein (DUF849 family)